MKIIVGLGNPGRVYASNRHNLGFMCLNYFARTHGIKFDKRKAKARIGSGEIAGSKVILARPQTYMNRSGESVSLLVRKFDINPHDLLVIHDDLDLPLGKIRIRHGGGSGGHKGIESITSCLDNQDFVRLRVGIGRPSAAAGPTTISDADAISYVLGDFTPDQKQIINQAIPRVSEAILYLLTEDITAAMNRYN